MKTRILLFILTALFLNTTNSMAIEGEKAGKQITKLLKSINNWDFDTYKNHMATPDDILEKLLASDNDALKTMAAKSVEEANKSWAKKLDKEFKKICSQGEELEINWKKIKYKDFTCELDEVGIEGIYKGKLFFSYNNKTYKINVGFLTNQKGVRIGVLEHLKEIK